MDNPHRVLIVGAGSIGERHLRCFRATGRAEVAFVEIDESLRKAIAARYGVLSFGVMEAALENHFDAAVIATPAPLHVPLATRLVERGIPVLIEKPLSTNGDGIDHLQRLVEERGVVAGVAYVLRVHPALAAMREALRQGRFGKPMELVAVSGQHFPTYRPAYRNIYYADRAQGGGAIQDALTHEINAGEWLIGPVERLVADAAHQVLDGVEVEDTVHVLTRQGGALGCYTLNQYQAPNEMTISVVCERGTVRFESEPCRWRWLTEPGGAWHDETVGPLARDTPFIRQAHVFLDAVQGKAVLPCSLAEGLQTLKVNLAALASAATGAWQAIS